MILGQLRIGEYHATLIEPRPISVSFQIRISGKYHSQAGSTNKALIGDDDEDDDDDYEDVRET